MCASIFRRVQYGVIYSWTIGPALICAVLTILIVGNSMATFAQHAVSAFEGKWRLGGKEDKDVAIIKRKGAGFEYQYWMNNRINLDFYLSGSGNTIKGSDNSYSYRLVLSSDSNHIDSYATELDGPAPGEVFHSVLTRVGNMGGGRMHTAKGVRAVQRNGKWYLTEANGHQAGPFDNLHPLGDGQYAAKSGGLWRVYDSDGNLASVFTWHDIEPLASGCYAGLNANGQWQVLETNGHPASAFTWSELKLMPGGGLMGKSNGRWQHLDKKGHPGH